MPKSVGGQGDAGNLWNVGSHEDITAKMRRQMDHSTELTGWSETPAADYDRLHDVNTRLTPNCYNWFTTPEKLHGPDSPYVKMSHKDRYFTEKSSHAARELLEGAAHPNTDHMEKFHARERQVKTVESIEDRKHRTDIAYYSDVFWKDNHTDVPQVRADYHPKKNRQSGRSYRPPSGLDRQPH